MTVASTPTQVSHVQLLILKGRLSLESKGMKSRGGSTRPMCAAMLGLKPRDSYDKYMTAIVAKIEESLQSVAEEAQMAGEAHNAAINGA